MPELPEVEHTRRSLERWGMVGATFERVRTNDARIVRPMTPGTFVRRLTKKTIASIDRKGKWLRFILDDGTKLFVHLGMTGWFFDATGGAVNHPLQSASASMKSDLLRFERVRFDIIHERIRNTVIYVDPRRWGRMILSKDDIDAWTELGPDPLTDGIDVERLVQVLTRRKKQSIKEALMDQTVLAGVGNIQAIEALWKAEIDPRSRASALTSDEARVLARAFEWTIRRTLRDLASDHAGAANPFLVYGRKGEACPRCHATFERIELGGRSTTFCPRCQRPLGSVLQHARSTTAGFVRD